MTNERSLKQYLITYLVGTLLIFSILAAVATHFTSEFLMKEIGEKNHFTISVITQTIERSLQNPLDELTILRNTIDQGIVAPDKLKELLHTFVSAHNHVYLIQLADSNGITQTLVPEFPQFIGTDISGQEYFRVITRKKQPYYWSATFISPQLNRPVVTLSVPTKSGVLTSYIAPANILEQAQKLTIGQKSFITISDQYGTYASHTDATKVLQRAHDDLFAKFKDKYQGEVINDRVEIDGREYIATVDFIQPLGWSIAIYQAVEEVYAPAQKLTLFFTLSALVLLAISVLIAAREIRIIQNTLERFLTSTQIIASGNYDIHVQKTAVSELNALGAAFDTMAASIRERQSELQHINRELSRELEKNRRADRAFKTLLHSSVRSTGAEFFDSVVYSVSDWLGTNSSLIGEVIDGQVHPISVVLNGKKMQGFPYSIDETPCLHASESGYCYVPEKAESIYPNDAFLVNNNITSYVGVPLRDAGGRPTGILCAFSTHELKLPERAREIMDIVAARASVELEHMKALSTVAQTLKEKEIMLKEIHHRVKNNMQIVSSLLTLQTETMQNPELADALRDASNRIQAMSLIHQKLYQSTDFSSFDFAEYSSTLVERLIDTFSSDRRPIVFHHSIVPVTLDIDLIIPLALIMNEAITNSIKHAFTPETEAPEIFVKLEHVENDMYRMSIGDNGRGAPMDLLETETESFGVQLIVSLVDQIGGTVCLKKVSVGTCIEIGFTVRS